MKSKLFLSVITLFFTQINLSYGKFTNSFVVELFDQKIKVTSPLKKVEAVSIIIKNTTFEKTISELRSESKVLKRFVVPAGGREVIQVNFSNLKKLFYVPISPPFETVELRFNQKAYEVPEKK
jgi:hypothetical protein